MFPHTWGMADGRITLQLAADPKAPRHARRSIEKLRPRLAGGLERTPEHLDDVLDTITLLVNELVTNSVKFAGEGSIEIRLTRPEKGPVRVEVLDDGPGFVPGGARPGLTDTSGRGLLLVESLSDRWGVKLDGRTCVWFEIDPPEMRSAG
jgi:hypothetical protein